MTVGYPDTRADGSLRTSALEIPASEKQLFDRWSRHHFQLTIMEIFFFLVTPVALYACIYVALRMATTWLRVGRVAPGRTASVALMQTLILLLMTFPIILLMIDGPRIRGAEFLFLSPLFFGAIICIMGVINYSAIPSEDAEPPEIDYLTFPHSVAIGALMLSITVLSFAMMIAMLAAIVNIF